MSVEVEGEPTRIAWREKRFEDEIGARASMLGCVEEVDV